MELSNASCAATRNRTTAAQTRTREIAACPGFPFCNTVPELAHPFLGASTYYQRSCALQRKRSPELRAAALRRANRPRRSHDEASLTSEVEPVKLVDLALEDHTNQGSGPSPATVGRGG